MRRDVGNKNPEAIHKYRVIAWPATGQNGITKTDSAPNAIHFAAPPKFGGTYGRWSPEDLLLSSLASCFAITFNTMAEHSGLVYMDLEIEVEGTVSKAMTGYRFTEVVIRPKLKIAEKDDQARALELLNKAEKLCLVLRALDIPQRFRVEIEAD